MFKLFKSSTPKDGSNASESPEPGAPLATPLEPEKTLVEEAMAEMSASVPGETPASGALPPASSSVPESEPLAVAIEEEVPFVDFESEFAALPLPDNPVPTPPGETAQGATAPKQGEVAPHSVESEGELEEWSEPLAAAAPEPLIPSTILKASEGQLRIEEWLEARGNENIYQAWWQKWEGDEQDQENARVREAGLEGSERLAREAMWRAHWDATGRIPMLPRLLTQFKEEERTYLATEMPTQGATLAHYFTEEEDSDPAAFLSEVLLVLTQVAAFLVRLHGAGFAHLGLRPDIVVQGKPVQILDCSFAAPVDEALEAPLSFAGYSAPELSRPGSVDVRSDIYSVGAMLYRAVTGSEVPETGVDFTIWKPRIVMAGVPQILRRCLGPIETRFASAEELRRALVKLKNRLRPSVAYDIAGLSTIGLEPTRSTNQDAFGFLTGAWESESGPTSWAAFCVADGMGGMAAGEVASEVAVNAFLGAASRWCAEAQNTGSNPPTAAEQTQRVKEWAALANEAVVKALDARNARGGCTLDAAFIIERRLCIAHVGDSRLYLLRDGNFELLSRDHSYVMSLLLQGEITFDQIRTHSDRNKVTRSLGERHPQPDYFIDTLAVTKGASSFDLQANDVLLACSDGLWEPVVEAEMLEAIAGGDLQKAARDMLRLALQRGAPDNATLVLLCLEEGAAPVFA